MPSAKEKRFRRFLLQLPGAADFSEPIKTMLLKAPSGTARKLARHLAEHVLREKALAIPTPPIAGKVPEIAAESLGASLDRMMNSGAA